MFKVKIKDKDSHKYWADFIYSEALEKLPEPASYPAVLAYHFYDDVMSRTCVIWEYVTKEDFDDDC